MLHSWSWSESFPCCLQANSVLQMRFCSHKTVKYPKSMDSSARRNFDFSTQNDFRENSWKVFREIVLNMNSLKRQVPRSTVGSGNRWQVFTHFGGKVSFFDSKKIRENEFPEKSVKSVSGKFVEVHFSFYRILIPPLWAEKTHGKCFVKTGTWFDKLI